MAYPTISDVKSYLGRTDTNADTKLTQVLARTIKYVENYCGQKFVAQNGIVQTTQGNGSDILRLAVLPIIAVTSVVEAGITLTQGFDQDYILWAPSSRQLNYFIKRLRTTKNQTIDQRYNPPSLKNPWDTRVGSIVVTYNGGMSTTPDDIFGAIVELCAILGLEKRFTYTTDEGVDRTVIQTSVPDHVRSILDSYRVPYF